MKSIYAGNVPNGTPIMTIFLAPLAENDDVEDSDSDEEITEDKVKKFVNNMNRTEFETMPYPIIIDSGAAESVLPEKWCPQAATKKPTGKGRTYTAANGSPIKDAGSKMVTMVTKDGQWHDMNFRMCDVTRPLASVYKICEN